MLGVINAQAGFFLACTGRAPLPQPVWEFEQGRYLKLHISSDVTPLRVTQWTANTATRDFRRSVWTQEPAIERDGQWLCRQLRPEAGHAALFGEGVYQADGRDCPLSTIVCIIGAQAQ